MDFSRILFINNFIEDQLTNPEGYLREATILEGPVEFHLALGQMAVSPSP